MPKIEVNKVAEILLRNQLEPPVLRQIVEEMNLLVQPESDEELPPPVKKQFVIIVADPEGDFPSRDFAGWVVQIPESESPVTALERVYRGAYEFNTTRKGRMMPAVTVGDAIESVPAKHFREAELWVKTKIPVLVVRSDNRIPQEPRQG